MNKNTGTLEVTLSEITDNDCVLTTSNGELIRVPKHLMNQNFEIGESIIMEFKKTNSPSLEALVQNAQKHHDPKDEERMRKLLEQLIN